MVIAEAKGKTYTDFEDKLLLAQVGHVPVRVIAQGMGRTPSGVYMRLTELRHQGRYPSNVKYKTPPRARIRPETENYQYFTGEEDRLICVAFDRQPLTKIAEVLGRCKGSVSTRIRYLRRHGKLDGKVSWGYQKFRPW
ncbi:unnamed protein product, partial [marine sediment metagenome]